MRVQSLTVALLAALAVAASVRIALANPLPAQADSRRLWAYPKGVIVSSDGGKVRALRSDEEVPAMGGSSAPSPVASPGANANAIAEAKRDDLIAATTGAELGTLARTFEQRLTTCLAGLRDQTPPGLPAGAKVAFALDFRVTADGGVDELAMSKRGGSAELPACADELRQGMQTHKFEAPADGHPRVASVTFEGLILSDDDAKGRGFQFLEAERAWEATLKAHRQWFSCGKDADCTVAADKCEVRGVNTNSLQEYRDAIGQRKKAGCQDGSRDTSEYRAVCRGRRCTAQAVSQKQ
jgi:hypothetical protein